MSRQYVDDVHVHESTCNGFGDIWWTDNPINFSSIDSGRRVYVQPLVDNP